MTKFFVAALLMVTSVQALARERRLLNDAMLAAAEEKAALERAYRASEQRARAQKRAIAPEDRAIAVEIGDGLAAEADQNLRMQARGEPSVKEEVSFSRLEREWQEVNDSMQNSRAARPSEN